MLHLVVEQSQLQAISEHDVIPADNPAAYQSVDTCRYQCYHHM